MSNPRFVFAACFVILMLGFCFGIVDPLHGVMYLIGWIGGMLTAMLLAEMEF